MNVLFIYYFDLVDNKNTFIFEIRQISKHFYSQVIINFSRKLSLSDFSLFKVKKRVCQKIDTPTFTAILSYEENELPVITPSNAVAIVTTIFKIMLHLELGILLIIVPPFDATSQHPSYHKS